MLTEASRNITHRTQENIILLKEPLLLCLTAVEKYYIFNTDIPLRETHSENNRVV